MSMQQLNDPAEIETDIQVNPKDVSIHVDVSATHSFTTREFRRIPMSGLKLCGRRWLCGAEDLCVPAFFAILFSSTMFSLVLVTLILTYTNDIPSICINLNDLRRILKTHVAVWGAATLNDVLIIISSLRTNMFRPNRWIVRWLYLRACIAAAIAAAVILYTIVYINGEKAGCVPDTLTSSATVLHRMFLMLLVMFWIMIAFGTCTITCTWGCGQCCVTAHRQSLWVSRLRRMFCCFDVPMPLQSHRDVLGTVASIMANLFQNQNKLHITPSDLIVGLFLVESSQRLRKKRGRQFRFAASPRRWEPTFASQAQMIHSPEPYTTPTIDPSWWPQGQGLGSLAIASKTQVSPRPASPHHHAAPAHHVRLASEKSHHSNSHSDGTSTTTTTTTATDTSTDAASIMSLRVDMLTCGENAQVDAEAEADLVQIAESGVQPKLQPQDWRRIAEMFYFTRYIQASYGAIVYTVDRTCKACCMGHLCIPCRHSNKYKTEHFVGSGCGVGCYPNRCCHWSINAFMRFANVAREDILYARLHDAPIYYVVVDRPSRRLVIACRGTNSVTDCIIDIDAKLTSLDQHGFTNSYAHQGMYENAVRCRDDIVSVGIVKQFMDANPDYKIVCVGHSLGGATAFLLTLLLRELYNTRGLRCLILASPLLVDAATANHPWVLERVTTINYHNDFVTRASLANVFQLKKQIQCAFNVSTSNKFKVLSASYRRRFSLVFEHGHDDDAYDLYKRIKDQDIQEEHQRARALMSRGPRHPPPAPPTTDRESLLTSPPAYASDAININTNTNNTNTTTSGTNSVSIFSSSPSPSPSPSPSAVVSPTPLPPSPSRDTRASSEFHMHLRRCYTPGRVYHMLPTKQNKKRRCGPSPRPFRTIYPAAHETFQEMRISKNMFVEHFPINYWLTELDIPQEYLDDRTFDRE